MISPKFRPRAFRAALAAAGYQSVAKWAADRGKNPNQIYGVIAQTRSEPRTLAAVDVFIVDTLIPFMDEIRAELDMPAPRRRRRLPIVQEAA